MIITIITIIICLIVVLLASLYYWCKDPIIYKYDSFLPGPKIVLITATHGDELAPHNAVIKYLKSHKIKKGKLSFIIVNKCGILFNDREQGIINPFNDINRNYGKNKYINNIIEQHIDDATLVVDFHESIDYDYIVDHKKPTGIGNSMMYNNNYIDVENVINDINIKYKGPQWTSYNMTRNQRFGDIDGSLSNYCDNKNINYILVETTKKDDYNRRLQITKDILEYIFYKYLT